MTTASSGASSRASSASIVERAAPKLSRGALVYERLRGAIRDGRFAPGERVRETDVAAWLGVSRTPVREALRRLQADGLLTFEPWRGMIVAELDPQRINELYAMREVLEGAAARFAARHASDADLAAIEEALSRQEAAGDDATALDELNRRYHAAIYRAAHNRYLVDALGVLADALALLRTTTFSLPGRPASGHAEHAAVVAAIAARDPDAAEERARHHIRRAHEMRLRLIGA